MARVPRHTMTQAKHAGVNVPQGAFSATTRAVAGLIKNVNGNVDALVKQGFQAQDLRNREEIRQKNADMRNLQREFMQDVEAGNVDPAQWVPQWQERLDGFKGSMYQKGDPDDVVKALDSKFSQFSEDSTLTVNGGALKENRRRAKAGYSLEYSDMIKRGDFDGAAGLVESYAGILDPHEVAGAKMEIKRESKKATMEIAMGDDAIKFSRDIEGGKYGLSPIMQKRWQEKAEREISSNTREAMTAVNQMLELDAFEDEDQLGKFMDTFGEGTIPEGLRQMSVKSFKENAPLDNAERYDLGDRMRDDYRDVKAGAITLDQYKTRWNVTNSEVMAIGKRPNSGGLRYLTSKTDPINIDPDNPTADSGVFKDAHDLMEDLARERAGTRRKTDLARIGSAGDTPDEDKRVAHSRKQAVVEEFEVRFRDRVETLGKQWIAGLGKVPNSTEMQAWIDKNQPAIIQQLKMETEATAEEATARRGYTPVGLPESTQKLTAEAYRLLSPVKEIK